MKVDQVDRKRVDSSVDLRGPGDSPPPKKNGVKATLILMCPVFLLVIHAEHVVHSAWILF